MIKNTKDILQNRAKNVAHYAKSLEGIEGVEDVKLTVVHQRYIVDLVAKQSAFIEEMQLDLDAMQNKLKIAVEALEYTKDR